MTHLKPQFRLVILDYPKTQLRNPIVQKVFQEVLSAKQINFERASETYIAMDKHDMVGSHLIIYDVANLFAPKIIAAIRISFEDRAKKHALTLPLIELVPKLNSQCQTAFERFHMDHANLVDCNSLFIDESFTQKNMGLRLPDICYTLAYLHVTRMGYDHLAGGTNEKFRSSRWLKNIGPFDDGLDFTHPLVPDPHKLIMLNGFNLNYLQDVYLQNRDLFDSTLEFLPDELKIPILADYAQTAFNRAEVIQFPKQRIAG